ncbi:glycosyltransferase [Pirellulaceae bacterium SH501]
MNAVRKKILVYAPTVGRGGVRTLVLRLVDAWSLLATERGWDVKVLSNAFDESGRDLPWPEGMLEPLNVDGIENCRGVELCNLLQAKQNEMFRQLKRHAMHADIVWLPQPWWTMRISNEIVDFPAHIVPTIHDLAFDELGWNDLFGDRFRDELHRFISVSSLAIFSSNVIRKRAMERYDMPQELGRVVYLADFVPDIFDTTSTEGHRVKDKYQLPEQYVLAFHASGHKDPLCILEAICRLRDQNPQDFIPLVIAGHQTEAIRPDSTVSGEYVEKIRAYIQRNQLQIGKHYFVLGYIPTQDIGGLYAGATACVTASKSEAGLSGCVFESFKAKVPLIHSDIEPFIERLGLQNDYALRFRCGDSLDLYESILEVLRDPRKACERAKDANLEFCNRHWINVAEEYLDLFSNLVSSGPSKRIWSSPVDSIQRVPSDLLTTRASWLKRKNRRIRRALSKLLRR